MADEDSRRQRRRFKRNKIVNEILDTERHYVANLKLLAEFFSVPLHPQTGKKKGVLSEEEYNNIFSNTAVICSLNENFLADVELRVKGWSPTQLIADVFLTFAPYFKMYTAYVNNHGRALDTLDKLDSGAKKKLQKLEEKARGDKRCADQTLQSFLILPIQRIPRYKLLLGELLKHTESHHPDRYNIMEALSMVAEVANHINEAVRSRESQEAIIALQDRFIGGASIISPSRFLVRQGGPFGVSGKQVDAIGGSSASLNDINSARSAGTAPQATYQRSNTAIPVSGVQHDASEYTHHNRTKGHIKGGSMAFSANAKTLLLFGKGEVPLVLFLFNDVLVTAQVAAREKYREFLQIPLNSEVRVRDVEDDADAELSRVATTKVKKSPLQALHTVEITWVDVVLSVRFDTEEDKRSWLAQLQNCLQLCLDQELLNATNRGVADEVRTLASVDGVNVNAKGKDGFTPLMLACQNGNIEVCNILLDAGADVRATNIHGQTALHLAVKDEQAGCATVLAAHGANVLVRDRAGVSPLSLVLPEHLSVGSVISPQAMRHRKSFYTPDKGSGHRRGYSTRLSVGSQGHMLLQIARNALFQAARTGSVDTLDLLLAWINDENHPLPLSLDDREVLLTGQAMRRPSVNLTAADGPTTAEDGGGRGVPPDSSLRRTPLLLSAARGKWPFVARLIDSGADISLADTEHHSVLHFLFGLAAESQSALYVGTNPVVPPVGSEPKELATLREEVFVESLLWSLYTLRVHSEYDDDDEPEEKGRGRVDSPGSAPVDEAARTFALCMDIKCEAPSYDIDVVVRQTGDRTMTALYEFYRGAKQKDHDRLPVASALLWRALTQNRLSAPPKQLEAAAQRGPVDLGLDLLVARTGDKASLLLMAAADGEEEIVRFLLLVLGKNTAVAATNRDRDGCTPLMKAVVNGHTNVVSALVEVGSKTEKRNLVNTQDAHGRTPLMEAVAHNNAEIAKLLFHQGAVLSTRDAQGQTALGGPSNAARTALVLEILDAAVSEGEVDDLVALQKQGVDVWATVEAAGKGQGYSPVARAARKKHLKVVAQLCDMYMERKEEPREGQGPALPDKDGWTAVMQAVVSDNQEMLELLMKYGPIVGINSLCPVSNSGGRDVTSALNATALMAAVGKNSKQSVRRLIDGGAETGTENAQGKTALDMANKEMQRLLTDRIRAAAARESMIMLEQEEATKQPEEQREQPADKQDKREKVDKSKAQEDGCLVM